MTLRVYVEPVVAHAPSVAARAVTDAIESEAPRSRDPIVLWVAGEDRPGFTPAAWTADGVFEALGPAARLSVTGATSRAGEHASADEGGTVELALPGAIHKLRVRQSWIGARLCLVAPCVEGGDGCGPVTNAFAALARRLGGVRRQDPDALAGKLGARWAPMLFSHVGVVLDVAWWATANDRAPLVAVERCLGLSVFADADAARADRWLAARVGRTAATGHVDARGSAGTSAWPAIAAPNPARPWARRNTGGLWRTCRPAPAAHRRPGALARVWDEYGREDRR